MNRLNIRQGDVLFMPIARIPDGKMKNKRENGTAAYGEVTGHSHTVMTADEATVFEIDGYVHLVVNERGISIEGDAARLIPELNRILADSGETPERRDRATELLEALPTAGAIFLHGTEAERALRPIPAKEEDRHFPVALQPGEYSVPVQREYSPEEIRNVVD